MLDEFLPIYMALARATDHHPAMTQTQVDELDISVVAAYLRADAGGGQDAQQMAAQELTRRRVAAQESGQRVRWADLAD